MDDELDTILIRYFSGTISDEEQRTLDQWLARDPDNSLELERLRELWEASAEVTYVPDTESALMALKKQAAARSKRPIEIEVERTRRRPTPRRASAAGSRSRIAPALRIAAMVSALLIGGALVRQIILQPWVERDDASPTRVVETGPGQLQRIALGDGTIATLGVASRLEIPADYGRSTRDLYLDGEAYFDVTHDPGKPFRVHTDQGVAEDLGTRFNVRTYPELAGVEVVVAEGRVALGRTAAGGTGEGESTSDTLAAVVLEAGDLGRLDVEGAVHVDHDVNVATRLAWTERRLAFDQAPLREVLAQLGRWYDLDTQVTDTALAMQPVTVSFDNQPLSEVLELLASAMGARYERDGRTVTFTPRPPREVR